VDGELAVSRCAIGVATLVFTPKFVSPTRLRFLVVLADALILNLFKLASLFVLSVMTTAAILSDSRCAAPSLLQFTRRPVTCEWCSCYWGRTKLGSTVRYLGIEVDDALSISEQIEL
jgi:hypothetical protein